MRRGFFRNFKQSECFAEFILQDECSLSVSVSPCGNVWSEVDTDLTLGDLREFGIKFIKMQCVTPKVEEVAINTPGQLNAFQVLMMNAKEFVNKKTSRY